MVMETFGGGGRGASGWDGGASGGGGGGGGGRVSVMVDVQDVVRTVSTTSRIANLPRYDHQR